MAKRKRPRATTETIEPETTTPAPRGWSVVQLKGIPHTSAALPREKRPHCQNCNKPLVIITRRMRLAELKSSGALAFSSSRRNGDSMDVRAWFGEFEGWGYDARGIPLFCSQPCAAQFAHTMWMQGHRVLTLDTNELIDREQV